MSYVSGYVSAWFDNHIAYSIFFGVNHIWIFIWPRDWQRIFNDTRTESVVSNANDSVFVIIGITLQDGDVITVRSSAADEIAFSLFGVETS